MNRDDWHTLLSDLQRKRPPVRYHVSKTNCEPFFSWASRHTKAPRKDLQNQLRRFGLEGALENLESLYKELIAAGRITRYRLPKPIKKLVCHSCGETLFEKIKDVQRHCLVRHDRSLTTKQAERWISQSHSVARRKEAEKESKRFLSLYDRRQPPRPFGSPNAGSPGLGKRR